MLGYADIKVKLNHPLGRSYDLYIGKKKTDMSLVQETGIAVDMWRIKFPEGDLSLDFYNLDRAVDNAKRYLLSITNGSTEDCPQ